MKVKLDYTWYLFQFELLVVLLFGEGLALYVAGDYSQAQVFNYLVIDLAFKIFFNCYNYFSTVVIKMSLSSFSFTFNLLNYQTEIMKSAGLIILWAYGVKVQKI